MKRSTVLLSLLIIPGILLSQYKAQDSLHPQDPIKNELN
jgi:hypothetical protein